MIEIASSLPVGDAVRLQVSPDADSEQIRVLRRTDANFVGPVDPGALVVYEGMSEGFLLDLSVANGATYFYKGYLHNGTAYQDSAVAPVSCTVGASYTDGTTDMRALLRERISLGLRQEIARGLLRVRRGDTPIDVRLGPPVYEEGKWPVVSVHVNEDRDAEHGLADDIGGIGFERARGWLSNWVGQVNVWSQNPDERHALYRSLLRILIANIEVFEGLGIKNLSLRFSDQDFISGEYDAPVYVCACNVTCQVPSHIGVCPPGQIINQVDAYVDPPNISVEVSL